MGKGGRIPGAGRKKVPIDLRLLQGLVARDMSIAAIAALMSLPRKTLSHRIHNDPAVKAAYEQGRANMELKAKDNLWKLAERGNTAAAIFLTKNVCGYKDNPEPSHEERKAAVLHIVFDAKGRPIEDKDTLAPRLPDPPDAEAQDEAEAKALAGCRPATPAN
jgi:hypothetical protein